MRCISWTTEGFVAQTAWKNWIQKKIEEAIVYLLTELSGEMVADSNEQYLSV